MKKLFNIIDYKTPLSKILLIVNKKFHLSDWIINCYKKKNKKIILNQKYQIFLINVKKDLGINKSINLKTIHNLIIKKNYKLVPPELVPFIALKLKKNKNGTWIRFATPLNSLVDDDGIYHMPKIGFALNKKYIETYWSYPKSIFHPHNSFIVCKTI